MKARVKASANADGKVVDGVGIVVRITLTNRTAESEKLGRQCSTLSSFSLPSLQPSTVRRHLTLRRS